MHEVDIAGFPALATEGDAGRPLVLFLHGAFTTHQCFRGWLREFEARGWRCAAASLRGRLDVPPPNAEGVSLWQYLDDARRIVDALAKPRRSLATVSVGFWRKNSPRRAAAAPRC